MKTKLFTLLFMTFTFCAFAQEEFFDCGTPNDTTTSSFDIYSRAADQGTLDEYGNIVYNMFIWGINKDDCTSGNKLTESDALRIVAYLNIEYNKFNIFFKYNGYDYIDATSIYTPNGLGAIKTYALANNKVKENSFNMYIPFEFSNGIAGVAISNSTFTAISSQVIIPYAVIHEVGHNFKLKHTHSGEGGNNCEHVTRDPFDLDDPNDPNDTYFNADVAGDEVVDTAAVGILRGTDLISPECTYIGNEQDCQGTYFDIFPEDVKNYMAYGQLNCVDQLSIGQGIRARETIEADTNGVFADAQTTIPALYEPYDGEYSENGTSLSTIKFQPGFDYNFLSCYPNGGFPQPADYYNTSFTYLEGGLWAYNFYKDIVSEDYHTIIHKDRFALRILQLDDIQPRKCWNTGQGASGGTLILFNDGVLNSNVTITSQDSTAINNPQLIETLQPGLYNIVKEYEGSGTEENVILKENN